MIDMDVDTALSEVPVNAVPLTDDTDFKSTEEAVAYDAAGMDLEWHFVTTAGAYTVTAVTPTTGGAYDWAHQGNGMYTIEIPASGGASVNNDAEGFGYFVGKATGVLPWRGPTIRFRAAALNDALTDGGDVLDVNVTQSLGDPVTNEHGTIASATSSTITLPTLDSAGGSVPDADQYEYGVFEVVAGTGYGQVVLTTTAGASARQYNVLSGTMPTQLDNTSKYNFLGKWLTNTALWLGSAPNALVSGRVDGTVGAMQANVLTAAAAAADFVTEVQTAITGGAYDLDTDANGRIRVVDGTGVGELDTSSGRVLADLRMIFGSALFEGGSGNLATNFSGLFGTSDTAPDAVWSATTRRLTDGTNINGSTFTAIPWNASWDAEVESEVNDALVALHLDHLLAADYDPASKPGVSTALLNELVENDGGVARFTTNALEQGPGGGGAGTFPGTADEWAALKTILGVPNAGTTPEDPTAGVLDTIRDRIGVPASTLAADIAAQNDITAADVWAAGTRTLTAGTNIVLAKGTGVTGFNDLSAAQVNAEVLDVLNTDTFAQPSGVPTATVSLAEKIGRLYQALTSELAVTATALTFFAHGGAALWKKTIADDGTTYSETDALAP